MDETPMLAEPCPPPPPDGKGLRCLAAGPENLAVSGHAEECKRRVGHDGPHMAVFDGRWWRWPR